MSERYPGGFITKNYVAPTPAAAPGIWTLDQQLQAQKTGTWPYGGPLIYIEDVFSTYIYKPAADFTNYSINNGIDLSTKGGMTWFKARDAAQNNLVYDTARGSSSGSPNALITNSTSAQQTAFFDYVTPNTNGFTVNYLSGGGQLTNSGINFASWTFREQPKFFDVVTYTGDGTTPRNISHSLGSVPGCIIIKRTDSTGNWIVYHRSLNGGVNPQQYLLFLNSTLEQIPDTGSTTLANTVPTSTQFTVGTSSNVNASGGTYVAYLFAHDAGGFGATGTDNVVSCGSFTGNGSSTVSINLGYEPQWVMFKSTDASAGNSQWLMFDNMRGFPTFGQGASYLKANSSDAEGTNWPYVGVNATGFQVANDVAATGSFIYIAIRKGPMKVPTDGTKVFKPQLYTGTGATSTVTGVGFTPDVLLNLQRNANGAFFWDKLRGGNLMLRPPLTAAETTGGAGTTIQYGMDGYTLGADTYGGLNVSGATYSFNSLQRAPSFFDEVCYTGNGATQTVSHNLGAVPELMIAKGRSSDNNWIVYSAPVGNTKALILNGNNVPITTVNWWNNTSPTSSVFSLGGSDAGNLSGATQVAYLFATCPGVSKVGSYTGTGASQIINCGFTAGARFVLIKRTDSTGGWYTYDTARGMVTGTDPYLLLNSTAAEVNANYVFTSSTGFTIQAAAPAEINASGGTFIFLAIA